MSSSAPTLAIERTLVEKMEVAVGILVQQHAVRQPPSQVLDDKVRKMVQLGAVETPQDQFCKDVFDIPASGPTLDSATERQACDQFWFETASANGLLRRVAVFLRFGKDKTMITLNVIMETIKHVYSRLNLADGVKLGLQLIHAKASDRASASVLRGLDEILTQIVTLHSLELWSIHELLSNPTQNRLAPPHRVLTDYSELRRLYGPTFLGCLPVILTTDPIVRHYGFPPGVVVEIMRFSPKSLSAQPYYRRVVKVQH